MKRFMIALALVAVAGVTYVATAPGSQTASPTARQFKALKKEVAQIAKHDRELTQVVVTEAVLIQDCMAVAKPIDQFGNGSTTGYEYSNGGVPSPTPALNYADPSDANAIWFTGGTSQCNTDLQPAARMLRRIAGIRLH